MLAHSKVFRKVCPLSFLLFKINGLLLPDPSDILPVDTRNLHAPGSLVRHGPGRPRLGAGPNTVFGGIRRLAPPETPARRPGWQGQPYTASGTAIPASRRRASSRRCPGSVRSRSGACSAASISSALGGVARPSPFRQRSPMWGSRRLPHPRRTAGRQAVTGVWVFRRHTHPGRGARQYRAPQTVGGFGRPSIAIDASRLHFRGMQCRAAPSRTVAASGPPEHPLGPKAPSGLNRVDALTDPQDSRWPSMKAVLPVSLRPVAMCQSLGEVQERKPGLKSWFIRIVPQPQMG